MVDVEGGGAKPGLGEMNHTPFLEVYITQLTKKNCIIATWQLQG